MSAERKNVRLSSVKVGPRFRKSLGDLDSLARSMEEIGQLQPIGLTRKGQLIFGQRRLEAARALGWKTIDALVLDVDALLAEGDENTKREPFAPSDMVDYAEAIRAHIGDRQGQRTDILVQEVAQVEPGEKTRARAASAAGFGNHETYRQAKLVVDRGAPELREAMDSGAVSISAAAKLAKRPIAEQIDAVQRVVTGGARDLGDALRQIKREERVSRAGESVGIPDGQYLVIAADPPWAYDNSGLDQSAADHYDTLPADEIAARWREDVARVSTPQSVLFLWATSPLLPEGLMVMREWGFTYKAGIVWEKDRAPGIGWWLKTRHEHLLIGARDNTEHPLEKIDSIVAAAVSEHSRKPEVFYESIERMYPVSTERPVHLELFARRDRAGWQRGLYNQELAAE